MEDSVQRADLDDIDQEAKVLQRPGGVAHRHAVDVGDGDHLRPGGDHDRDDLTLGERTAWRGRLPDDRPGRLIALAGRNLVEGNAVLRGPGLGVALLAADEVRDGRSSAHDQRYRLWLWPGDTRRRAGADHDACGDGGGWLGLDLAGSEARVLEGGTGRVERLSGYLRHRDHVRPERHDEGDVAAAADPAFGGRDRADDSTLGDFVVELSLAGGHGQPGVAQLSLRGRRGHTAHFWHCGGPA